MILTIRGKRWRLVRLPPSKMPDDYGACDSPNLPNKQIKLRSNLTGELELDTLIHEMIHAAHWDISEEAIEQTATDIARALWRLGYRKESNDV